MQNVLSSLGSFLALVLIGGIAGIIEYTFPAKTRKGKMRAITQKQQVGLSYTHTQQLLNDKKVEVIYLPNRPNISRLTGPKVNPGRNSTTVVSVLIMIFFHQAILVFVGWFLFTWFRLKPS